VTALERMADTSTAEGPVRAPRSRVSTLLTALLVLVLVLLAARTFVAEPLRIHNASMAPTLVEGQHVLADKVSRGDGHWRRGDVVALQSPERDEVLVKRIVALAGDRVGLRDGRLVVDGRIVTEPYTDPDAIDSVYFGPVHVPAGHVFLLGDNRAESRDSRTFGPVATSAIMARIDAVIWPLPPSRDGLS
jgi:signal peptidase I